MQMGVASKINRFPLGRISNQWSPHLVQWWRAGWNNKTQLPWKFHQGLSFWQMRLWSWLTNWNLGGGGGLCYWECARLTTCTFCCVGNSCFKTTCSSIFTTACANSSEWRHHRHLLLASTGVLQRNGEIMFPGQQKKSVSRRRWREKEKQKRSWFDN